MAAAPGVRSEAAQWNSALRTCTRAITTMGPPPLKGLQERVDNESPAPEREKDCARTDNLASLMHRCRHSVYHCVAKLGVAGSHGSPEETNRRPCGSRGNGISEQLRIDTNSLRPADFAV